MKIQYEVKSGIIVLVGYDDFYFLETTTTDSTIKNSILDTFQTFIKISEILDSSGIDLITEKMKPFPNDYFKCGVWAEKNKIKFAIVELELKKKTSKQSFYWEEHYKKINRLCFFSIKNGSDHDMKYRFGNVSLKRITLIN